MQLAGVQLSRTPDGNIDSGEACLELARALRSFNAETRGSCMRYFTTKLSDESEDDSAGKAVICVMIFAGERAHQADRLSADSTAHSEMQLFRRAVHLTSSAAHVPISVVSAASNPPGAFRRRTRYGPVHGVGRDNVA